MLIKLHNILLFDLGNSPKCPMFLCRSSAVILLLGILLSSCQYSTKNADDETVKIGYIGPLTGDAVSYGTDTLSGVRLKVEEVNAQGGIRGKRIELLAEDGRCSGTEAASAARKLIEVDHVQAIIGGQCSAETLAAAPLAEEAGIVLLSPISSSPDITHAGRFVFRMVPSDAYIGAAFARYFASQRHRSIAIIGEQTDFTDGVRSAIRSHAASGSIVFDETADQGTKDYRALLTRLKNAEFDAFIPNVQSDASAQALIAQFRELGFNQPIVGQYVLDSATLGSAIAEAIEGTAVITTPDFGSGTVFADRYRSRFGSASQTLAWAAMAYDAAGILFAAMEQAGADDEAIGDVLLAMPSFEGVIGTVLFDENGDIAGVPYAVKVFENGEVGRASILSVE